jgi:DNA-binding transcriptional ArsR family regulator/protein-L-isoaspartate O-methyltransferase
VPAVLGAQDARWQLYRLLSEPARLRVLALSAEEELALSELAELLEESQPNVSRHAGPLRQAGLLSERRQGTRTFVRLAPEAALDPVVSDAVAAGRELCLKDGSLARVPEVVRARDARTREFFERPGPEPAAVEYAPELPAYLFALGTLVEQRSLAVDAGTGDGVLLDALAPIFERVIAFDRSEAQLERARRRVADRGYENVTLLQAEAESPEVAASVGAGADLLVASRMLHHAPLPRATLSALGQLLKPGGRLLVVDYCRHSDEELRERQADVWMGFDAGELVEHARASGFEQASVLSIPRGYVKRSHDGSVGWQVLSATRARTRTKAAPPSPEAEACVSPRLRKPT